MKTLKELKVLNNKYAPKEEAILRETAFSMLEYYSYMNDIELKFYVQNTGVKVSVSYKDESTSMSMVSLILKISYAFQSVNEDFVSILGITKKYLLDNFVVDIIDMN